MAEEGREYLCEYPFGREGQKWGLTIWAKNEKEAAERLKAIGAWGLVNGELVAVIPAYPGVGFGLRAAVFFRNLFRKRRAA